MVRRVFLASLALAAPAAAGVAADFVAVPSAYVLPSVRTLVVLPPSYASAPGRRYPILYFLHDAQGSEETLLDRGIAAQLAGEMRAGRLPEAIVVAPRGVGTWYVDSFDGKTRYARFLDEELVPFVDARYRTIAERRGRGAMGISMGGYGALRWGFASPDRLAVVAGLSPAVQQLDWQGVLTMPFFVRPMITNVFGKGPRANVLRRNDLYDILLTDPGRAAAAPEVFVRCGTEDRYRLEEVVPFFEKFLTALKVRNEVVIEPGGHDWSYWRRSFLPAARSVLGRLAP